MKPKRPAPLLVIIALFFLIGGVIYLVVKSLFSVKKITETKPKATPTNAEAESRRKEAETPVFRPIPAEILATPPAPAAPERPASVVPLFSGGNSAQNRSIPLNSGGKSNVPPPPAPLAPASVIVPASSASAAPKIPVSPPSAIPAMKIAAQVPLPPPIKKKFVTREDLASIFQRGARALTRTAAVAALKKIGFGKSAAYDALSENGRFSAWLQFAPDGIITWTE
jgi:hypothetical protein